MDSTDKNEKYCVVVKDEQETGLFFDAMMKKVDIKKYYYGLDNFYVLQILKDEVKNVFVLWTRWGRSGSTGQFQRTPFARIEDAVREFMKIFKQKSGTAWKDVKEYVKKEKKYDVKRIGGKLVSRNDVKLKFSNADFNFEKLLIPLEDLDYSVDMVNPIEFRHFIKPLVNDNNVLDSLQRSNFSKALMLLAPQDKPTVDLALELLKKLKKILVESNKHRFKHNFEGYSSCLEEATSLNSEYLEIIPKVNPTEIQTMLTVEQVDREINLLKSAFTLSYSVRTLLGAYLNQKRINPFDYILGTINVHMSVVDPNSEETNLILHYLNARGLSGYNLRNVIKAEDIEYTEEQNEKFDNTKNHMMLWHGTSATNVLSIIRGGLKIAPLEAEYHGSRYGHGLYFSDSFTLSSCFSAESEQEKYIFLCEVATGRMVNILSMSNPDLKASKEYDCIRAMPATGPDWDGSVVKDDIVYPIGRSINYPPPFLRSQAGNSFETINEFKDHIQKKVRSNNRRVVDMGGYEIEEDKSDDSEPDMDIDSARKTLKNIMDAKKQPVHKGKSKKNVNELILMKTSGRDQDDYPLFPNEVTAMTRNELTLLNNGLQYYSPHSEYIIYDDALVRVRYIIQLSRKSPEALRKEGSAAGEFARKKTRAKKSAKARYDTKSRAKDEEDY